MLRRAGDCDDCGEHELTTMAIAEGATNQIAQVLTAIAQLLWPVAILVLVYKLLPELKLIFHRIRESRNLKIKWGDKELSVQEAADNIQKVVGSLLDAEVPKNNQTNVTEFKSAGGIISSGSAAATVAASESATQRRVLWVDDRPKGNALEMAWLRDRGIQIDEAVSTEDGIWLFEAGKYALVVTDMYRPEDGGNPHAGIDLLKRLRLFDPDVKVIAYCATVSARRYGKEFVAAGGVAVTSDPLAFSRR